MNSTTNLFNILQKILFKYFLILLLLLLLLLSNRNSLVIGGLSSASGDAGVIAEKGSKDIGSGTKAAAATHGHFKGAIFYGTLGPVGLVVILVIMCMHYKKDKKEKDDDAMSETEQGFQPYQLFQPPEQTYQPSKK